ncbi:MAG: hypothetical protein WBE18_07915 [Gammaproteobacteria bacterium]
MRKLTPKPKNLHQRISDLELDIAESKADLSHYNELFKEKITSPISMASIAASGALGVFLMVFARRKLKARRIKKNLEHPQLQHQPRLHSPSFFSIATLMSLSSVLSTALTFKELFLRSREQGKKSTKKLN